MAACIYARFSTDDSETFSISSQVRVAKDYAVANGLHVADSMIFSDEITGLQFDRPAFNKVKRLCENQQITDLIVLKVNRISRTEYHALMFLREWILVRGIRLHIVEWGRVVKDTKDDILLFTLQSSFASFEHADLKERSMRGKKQKALDNIWIGNGFAKYGYMKEGTKRNTKLLVNDDEAEIVRMIFHMFVHQRMTTWDIAKFLIANGIPSPSASRKQAWKKGNWNDNTVRLILRNDNYIGNFYAFKYHSVSRDGKRIQTIRDEEEWIKYQFNELQIVDTEVWLAAQEILDSNVNHNYFPTKHEYLLNHRATCLCGTALGCKFETQKNKDGSKRTYSYYLCVKKNKGNNNHTCVIPKMNSKNIDAIIWESLESFLRNPMVTLEKLKLAQVAQTEEHKDAVIDLQQLERLRAKYHADLKERYNDWKEGLIPKEVYVAEKAELDERLRISEDMYKEFNDKVSAHVLSDKDIKRIVNECETIAEQLDELGSLEFKHKQHVIELLDIHAEIDVTDNGDIVARLFLQGLPYGIVDVEHKLKHHCVLMPVLLRLAC